MELGAGLVAAGSLAGVRTVSMVGNSGSGKSTPGRALAARLDVPYVELDAIFHQPNWTPLPNDEFRARVAAIVDGHGWVIDGATRSSRGCGSSGSARGAISRRCSPTLTHFDPASVANLVIQRRWRGQSRS